MEQLFTQYKERLKQISDSIQQSELLATFLESEEEADYKAIIDGYEPYMHDLYCEVADQHPLQLIALEEEMLDAEFEGLYIPKVLGYRVLRGLVNEDYKYFRAQDHFGTVLKAMAISPNFDYIAQRTGQGVEVGFALSSDIWITGLMENFHGKSVLQFFRDRKMDKYRDVAARKAGYHNYLRQFKELNYSTVEWPSSAKEFMREYPSVKEFMIYRMTHELDNSSLITPVLNLLNNKDIQSSQGYNHIVLIASIFMTFTKKDGEQVAGRLNKAREDDTFDKGFFTFLLELLDRNLGFNQHNHGSLYPAVSRDIDDEFLKYMDVLQELYTKGYMHQDTLEAVSGYHASHDGLSLPNKALRKLFLFKFAKAFDALTVEDYPDYFEWTKIFTSYIQIFDNQKFNQRIKEICVKYVRLLTRHYTDKRARDYQDIKKFTKAYFTDMNFMTPKQLTDFFKTKRKPKEAKEA